MTFLTKISDMTHISHSRSDYRAFSLKPSSPYTAHCSLKNPCEWARKDTFPMPLPHKMMDDDSLACHHCSRAIYRGKSTSRRRRHWKIKHRKQNDVAVDVNDLTNPCRSSTLGANSKQTNKQLPLRHIQIILSNMVYICANWFICFMGVWSALW